MKTCLCVFLGGSPEDSKIFSPATLTNVNSDIDIPSLKLTIRPLKIRGAQKKESNFSTILFSGAMLKC